MPAEERAVDDLRPLTLPIAALVWVLGLAWDEGVAAGAERGTAACIERAARVDGYLSKVLLRAYELCKEDSGHDAATP